MQITEIIWECEVLHIFKMGKYGNISFHKIGDKYDISSDGGRQFLYKQSLIGECKPDDIILNGRTNLKIGDTFSYRERTTIDLPSPPNL